MKKYLVFILCAISIYSCTETNINTKEDIICSCDSSGRDTANGQTISFDCYTNYKMLSYNLIDKAIKKYTKEANGKYYLQNWINVLNNNGIDFESSSFAYAIVKDTNLVIKFNYAKCDSLGIITRTKSNGLNKDTIYSSRSELAVSESFLKACSDTFTLVSFNKIENIETGVPTFQHEMSFKYLRKGGLLAEYLETRGCFKDVKLPDLTGELSKLK